MTIRRGEAWGETIRRPADIQSATTDAELARRLTEDPTAPVALEGGDLYRSIGSPQVGRADAQLLPIDLLDVRIDGEETIAAAHVVARRRWWRGRIVAVCNVDRIGDWDVAPRAHPNDGRFDVVEVDPAMTLRQRWQARRRVVAGTHVPHPHIATAAATERSWTFDRPYAIWVDGHHVADARSLAVTVRPDAASIVA